MNIDELKEQICGVSHCLWQLGFVAANDGNISVRLPDNTFLTTPTGISKRELEPQMLVIIDKNGNVIMANNGYKPSTEFKMHLKCYEERPDVNAVVHAHPPTATAFAVAHIPLNDNSMSEAVMFLGEVPIAPYAAPGSVQVAENVAPFLESHDTILLMNHGALCVGVDLKNAYYRMETLEHYAKVSLAARLLGGAVPLSSVETKECANLAKAYPIRHPFCKE